MEKASLTSEHSSPIDDDTFFGMFSLNFAARLLKMDGAPVALGSRAFDILTALVRQPGNVVSKNDLMRYVWPGTAVDESSLRVHVAALRKALRDGEGGVRFIATIPGRGYCFVAPVLRSSTVFQKSLPDLSPITPHLLPGRRRNVVGRDDVVTAILSKLTDHRYVTIVGPGGVGKTTVAIGVAYASLNEYSGAVYFVDLGSVVDPALLASTIATPLGLTISEGDPLASLVKLFSDTRMLIVLDCCEHLIDSVATLVEAVSRESPGVHLLITSREMLRVQAEYVYRLQPLETPPDQSGLTVDQVMAFSAVQLFINRLEETGHTLRLDDDDASMVAAICRKLDGLALAIELAAGRAGAFGLSETVKMLNGQSHLLWPGRRTALPRHQTLHATLDWSYNLLPTFERLMLCRLSVFVAPFPLAAVEAIMIEYETSIVLDSLAELVSKSLIASETISGARYYRLLDTTRAYASQKHASISEQQENTRRFAGFYADFTHSMGPLPPALSNTEIYVRLAIHLGNVRSSLGWAFGAHGDLFIAVKLAAGAMRLLIGLSLMAESRDWARMAIEVLDEATLNTQYELELQASLAEAVMLTEGSSDSVLTAFVRAIKIAEILGDEAYQLKLLVGLHSFHIRIGECQTALDIALRCLATAEAIREPGRIAGTRIAVGIALNMVGDISGADRHFRAALEHVGSAPTDRSNVSYLVTSQGYPARNLWLQGYPERAMELSKRAIENAARLKQPAQTCVILAWLIWVDFWTGDWARADENIRNLQGQAGRHGLVPYQYLANGMLAERMIRCGDTRAGIVEAQKAITMLNTSGYRMHTSLISCALAEGLGMIGQADNAVATIKSLIHEVENRGDLFIMPELMRVKGMLYAAQGNECVNSPEIWFRRSLAMAQAQGARSWELRTSTSLAQFLLQSSRPKEAHSLLAPILGWFKEGFATSDLLLARDALDQISLALV